MVYNSTPHSSTGYSPHYFQFSNEPELPVDFMFSRSAEDKNTKEELVTRLHEAHARAEKQLCKLPAERKERNDR